MAVLSPTLLLEAPLSPGQEALWTLHRLLQDSGIYNAHVVWDVPHDLDVPRLKCALGHAVAAHPQLRALFGLNDEGRPCQRIYDVRPLPFEEIAADDVDDAELSWILDRELRRPFQLEAEAPLRCLLLRRGPRAPVFVVVQHHINVDLWSLMCFMNDLGRAYGALGRGEAPQLSDVRNSYTEYVRSLERRITGDEGERGLAFWLARLSGMAQVLELPTDFPRPAVRTCNKAAHAFEIAPASLAAFRARLGALVKTSDFALYACLLHVLLFRYSRQSDISFAVPTAGRSDEYRGVCGYFANAIALRATLNGAMTFRELVAQQKPIIESSLAAGDYPYSLLASRLAEGRDPSRAALTQVSFVWESINRFENRDDPIVSLDEHGQELWRMGAMGLWRRHKRVQQRDDSELTFKVQRYGEQMRFAIEYNADLFRPETVSAMAGHFEQLVRAVTEQPDAPLSTLSMLTDTERSRLLVDWNASECADAKPLFTELFERHVAAHPDTLALVADGMALTYAELAAAANAVARRLLRSRRDWTDRRIGVYLERSPEVVITLLGILKAGGTYLPLDPDYPSERLRYVLSDAAPDAVITTRSLHAQLPAFELETVVLYEELPPATQSEDIELPVITRSQLAYMIYTSGSTGRPKGTMLDHGNLAHLALSQKAALHVASHDRVLQFASINFDASIFEIVLALGAGATLHLADRTSLLGSNLLGVLKQRAITVAILPPSLLAVLPYEPLPALRLLLVAGDVCPAELARTWSKGRRFVNAYGPTEATVWASFADVDGSAAPPIGKPIVNTRLHVLDDALNPQPAGIPGELYIGGDGLARGYWNRPELTAERFVVDPFREASGSRLYRTGDVARYLPDGNLEFLGRVDQQIKLRGYRVELGEIEAVLREHPAVKDARVFAHSSVNPARDEDVRLAAYLVRQFDSPFRAPNSSDSEGVMRKTPSDVDRELLRAFLEQRLPYYMVPSAFVWLDAWPLTPNRKVDREALPAPEFGRAEPQQESAGPRSELERILADLWKDCLGSSEVNVKDSFFDLGGHSLLLAKIHARLPAHLKAKLSLVDLYKYPTIEALAARATGGNRPAPRGDETHDARVHLPPRQPQLSRGGKVQIAIVGMAGRFPDADSVAEFWEHLCSAQESISFFTPEELRAAGVPDVVIHHPRYVPAKAVLRDVAGFDAEFFQVTPREAQITDPQQRLFLEVAFHALEDAACVPARFPGRIGVYGGAGPNHYVTQHLASRPELLTTVGDYRVTLANDKDFLCTRVAYKLDLDGPAVTVQTACSSSLVAIHMACQALRNGDCDAALAGGVSLNQLGRTGYLHQEGMILSPDGHCRAFDADAAGTVPGQGCAIVVLKRLEDALRDRDHIYAVIRGSAITNDGASKAGYTTPSLAGQARAIRLALADAGVTSDQISLVEAHGTGTPVGDPLELAALEQAFGESSSVEPPARDRGSVCAIGSVKTNIGHLDAAAGAAGLIKTAMALKSGLLPPSLHFRMPNPAIDLVRSRFHVNTELRPWQRTNGTRVASVNSLGMGGTNAHVVLAEAPTPHVDGASRPWHLLPLSARTSAALEAATKRLVEHLRERDDADFVNACYTLQVGRARFAHRRTLVCRTRVEALAALDPLDLQRVSTHHATERRSKLIFMFPESGSGRVDLARDLYHLEPVFRQTVDRCRAHLARAFVDAYGDLASDALEGCAFERLFASEPGLFVFELALATLFMEWGIEPDRLFGLGAGHEVAACIAGVFTREQALELVALRAQRAHGPERYVARAERHASRAPRRPLISSLSAAEGLTTLLSERDDGDDLILLELGPRSALSRLAREHDALRDGDTVLTIGLGADDPTASIEHFARTLGRLWERGVDIDFQALHAPFPRSRVSLPGYPFERTRHWIEAHRSREELPPTRPLDASELTALGESGPAEIRTSNAVEALIWSAWSECLGRTDFGVLDDFFELGGDSLVAVSLADRLSQSLEVQVTPSLLVQEPTIAGLTKLISERTVTGVTERPRPLRSGSASPLVSIQRGQPGLAPLLMVHPIGGEVFFYRDLARHLGSERPVLAFEAPSLSGLEPPADSVHELASCYLDELDRRGLPGPYFLGGSSFGGLVAYEMAQQRWRRNKRVPLLVMIDTPAPTHMPEQLTDSAAILHYMLQGKLALSLPALRRLDSHAQVELALAEARRQGVLQSLPQRLGPALFKTWIAHQAAARSYLPEPYDGSVVFYEHTAPSTRFPAQPHKHWLELVTGPMQVQRVPGDHVSMNLEPNVGVLASHLRVLLERLSFRSLEAR